MQLQSPSTIHVQPYGHVICEKFYPTNNSYETMLWSIKKHVQPFNFFHVHKHFYLENFAYTACSTLYSLILIRTLVNDYNTTSLYISINNPHTKASDRAHNACQSGNLGLAISSTYSDHFLGFALPFQLWSKELKQELLQRSWQLDIKYQVILLSTKSPRTQNKVLTI